MRSKKWLVMAMVTALLMGATGCSNQGTVDDAQIYGEGVDSSFETDDMQLETCIMAVGEEEVSLNELLFYVYQLKENYDGAMTSKLWEYSYEKDLTIADYTKERLVEDVAQIKIICQQAKADGYALTEEEANEASVAAGKFVEALPENAKDYNLQRELVEKIYKEHALAKKMYDVVGGTIDTEVSEKDLDGKEATLEAKEAILKEREEKAFADAYAKWKKNYKIVVSEPLLAQISFE